MNNKKLIAIVNKQIEAGTAMNALAHASLGFAHTLDDNSLAFMDYKDANGGIYPNISKYPFIVVQAKNSNQILTCLSKAKEKNIPFSAFTNTMTSGTWQEQETRTKQTEQESLIFYCLLLFGPKDAVSEITKKFSLWK